MRKIPSVLLFFVWLILSYRVSAQTGFHTNLDDSLIKLNCGENCYNLPLKIPHLRSTKDYLVSSIPYKPFAFVTATGNEVTSIYADDRYSAAIPMPFSFCYYDSVFSELVISSNGLLTFEKAVARCIATYEVVNPLPYAGGVPCLRDDQPNSVYYPRSSIMAAFSDLDLTAAASAADRKVEWRVEGTAPFRRFIVSFYHVGLYNGNCAKPNTFQIVLYETSGVIDIYVEQKACKSASSNGRAIMGLQNWAKDKAVIIPDKNSTVWEESKTAYRFIPSAGPSRYVSTELYDINNVFIAKADTVTTEPGWLDIKFNPICPAGNNQRYILKTVFSGCDIAGNVMGVDIFTIEKANLLGVQVISITPSDCGLPGTGTVAASVPQGIGSGEYTYSLNTPTYTQAFWADHGPVTFTGVPAGTYSLNVTDHLVDCAEKVNVIVTSSGTLDITFKATNTSCVGLNDGKIEVTPPNGTPPFLYSIDGINFGTGNVFAGLQPKTYQLSVHDNTGCAADNIPVTVTEGVPITLTTSSLAPSCPGMNNGSITITGSSGTAPLSYSIMGGPYQANPTFNGLASGTYFVGVKDAIGCVLNFVSATVPVGTATLTGRATPSQTTCNGSIDGSINVVPTSGTGPYEYSINNGANWQTSNLFNGLAPGNYSVLIREAGVCTSAPIAAFISQPPVLSMPAPITSSVICNGSKTGRIVVSPAGGTRPYSYSIDNLNFVPDSIFNVGAGNYTVYIRDASGCRIQTNAIAVTEPAVLNAGVAGITNATCNGGNDGAIRINVTGGMLPYSYSVDGNNFQSVNQLNVKNGTYDITVKDANDCRFIIPGVNVGLTDNLTLNVVNPQPICEGTSVQLQATGNAGKFSWTVAGTNAEIASVNNPVLSPRTTTTYTVMASLGNCIRSLDVQVPVLPAPVANAGTGNEICFGQDYQLQGSGGVSYSWSPVTYLNDPRSANPVVIRPAQTTTYSLRVTDNNNCQSIEAAKVLVTVTPPIKVTISPADTVVAPGAQFQLIASSAGNNYNWSPAGMLNNPGINAPTFTAGAAGTAITYTVIATTDAGCQGEGTAVVKIYNGPDIYVPNAFSPNGDGKNEEFYPFPVGIKQIKYFRVFNRWGQLLFATTTLYKGWNGKMGDMEQASGVYVWTFEGITSENRVISRSGTVTLIR